MKMVRNKGGITAWQVEGWKSGDFEMALHEDNLYVIVDGSLKVRIGDGRVDFLVGAPWDFVKALLSLTDEYDSEHLAGFATDTRA